MTMVVLISAMVGTLGFLCIVSVGVTRDTPIRSEDFPVLAVVVTVFSVLAIGLLGLAYGVGEKQGCIDALEGRPAYVQTTQPAWEKR